MSVAEGLKRKESGLDRIEGNNQVWLLKMRAWGKAIALSLGTVSTDDLRFSCGEHDKPTHEGAWGCVLRGKHWRKVGAISSRWPGNNHREIKTWEYVP